MQQINTDQVKELNNKITDKEYIVSDSDFETYKVQYKDTENYYVDLAQLIEDKNLFQTSINLNTFGAYLDGFSISNGDLVIKNGRLLLDNIEEGGCGQAINLTSTYISFEDVTIKAPQCEGNSFQAIIIVNNSNLSFRNCNLNVTTTANDRKGFIGLVGQSNIDIDNTIIQLFQNGNTRAGFIGFSSNNCSVTMNNSFAASSHNNYEGDNNDILDNFIDVWDGIVIGNLSIDNCVFRNPGSQLNFNAINCNLDCENIQINNSTFSSCGLNTKYSSSNTVSGNGYPHEYNDGNPVFDLSLSPERDWDSIEEFYLDDMWTFFDKADIDPSDMSKLGERFEFSIREINGQRGFILNFDESKSYTTDDFENLEEWGCHFDGNIEDRDIGNWGAVIINPHMEYFRFHADATVTSYQQFRELVETGEVIHREEPSIHEFNNNAIYSVTGYKRFIINPNTDVITRSLILNGQRYDSIPTSNVYIRKNEGDLWSLLNNARNNNYSIIDLNGATILCQLDINGEFNGMTLKNGSITAFEDGQSNLLDFHGADLTFENIEFNGRYSTGSGIIRLYDSSIIFKDCTFRMSTNNSEEKDVISVNDGCSLYLDNCIANFVVEDFAGDLQNKNFGIDFIRINSGNNANIDIINCPDIRIANDIADEDNFQNNCIRVIGNDNPSIRVVNSVIRMEGRGDGNRVIDTNMDNESIFLSNSDLQGALKMRKESAMDMIEFGHEYNNGDEFIVFYDNVFMDGGSVDPDNWEIDWGIFISKVERREGYYKFNYDGSNWKSEREGDIEVDLSEYGLTYNGSEEFFEDNWIAVIFEMNDARKARVTIGDEDTLVMNSFDDVNQAFDNGQLQELWYGIRYFNNCYYSFIDGYNKFWIFSNSTSVERIFINDKIELPSGELRIQDLWRAENGNALVYQDGSWKPGNVGGGGSDDGWQHVRNHDELMDVINNQDHANLDFSQFDYSTFDRNGYFLENKNYNLRKLEIYNDEWCLGDFEFFSKPVFTFKNCNIWFGELTINIHNADFNNPQNPTPLFDTINEYQWFNVDFENCSFNINSCKNIDEICVLKLDNIKASFKNTKCNLFGNAWDESLDEDVYINRGYIVKQIMNVTDQQRFNDPGMSEINIDYSNLSIINFGIECSCIKYVNNAPTRLNINYSNLNAEIQDDQYRDNALTLALPNGNSDRDTGIEARYSKLGRISAIPADDTFITWEANTTYNEGDCLEFVNPDNSEDKKYVKVINQFTSDDASWGDFWDNMNNGNIDWYYKIFVGGDAVSGFSPSNKINFNKNGNFNFSYVTLDGLNIDENLNVNNENWRLEIHDQNLNASDALNAIKELAGRSTGAGVGYPNYSQATTISSSGTISQDGWIRAECGYDEFSSEDITLTINNVVVGQGSSSGFTNDYYILVPVKSGDTYSYNGNSITFYPNR